METGVVHYYSSRSRKRQNEWADSRASHSYFPTGAELYLMSPALTWLAVLHLPASPMKYEACWTSPETTPLLEDWSTMHTLTIHITHSDRCSGEYSKVCECMHACLLFVYMLLCNVVCSCVGLCICVPSAEEPHPLINSDEWLEIVSPTPLSLSESFYLLTLLGILPRDVTSLLLS